MTNTAPIENSCNCNFVKDTIAKIDRLQKEVIFDTPGTCITCETSLFTSANNTIPVSLTTCCGNPITGNIALTGAETEFFRVESVRCGRFVTLRLLELETIDNVPTLVATSSTLICDLDCIACVQCYSPISVEVCTQSTNMQ